jgi:hypothetical protein
MIEKAEDFLPLWMLLSACFGFLVGELCGDYHRHWKCLQRENDELRERADTPRDSQPIEHALKEQRGVINDIHRRLCQSTPLLKEIRDAAHSIANNSQGSYRLLKKQQRTLRALSDYILPVPKGVEKLLP